MARRVRLVFRSRTPISIKIAAALFLAWQFSLMRLAAPSAPAASALVKEPVQIAITAGWLAFTVWFVVATLRLSRWPTLILALPLAAFVVWGLPMLTIGLTTSSLVTLAGALFLWLLMAALVLPHWRRLNWNLLGRLPPIPNPADEFS